MTKTNDEIFDSAIKFIENNKFKHSGLSNIYVIRKTDIDGKLIGEYYGRNLMTDYGMTRYFVNNDSFPSNVYIGNGSGSFNNTNNTLLSAIITEPAKISDNNISYSYPLYYDDISGIVTCICKYKTCYFDYNISGISDPVTISEYGIGTAYNALWTHSWVYDTLGSKTTVTKKPNERLTITIFMCLSYQESLITSGWENGRYTVITTMNQFFNKMNESSILTYARNGETVNRGINRTKSAYMNNEITLYTNLNSFFVTNTSDSQGYVDGFSQYTEGFNTLEAQTIDIPESFERIVRSHVFGDIYNIADQFGAKIDNSNLPFTQADITSVSLYNYKTGEWDIEEDFYNYPNYRYTETMAFTNLSTPIWYTNNNTIQKMYVYQNMYSDNPIIKIAGNVSTVYATDKYWDTSSWVHISDYTNIPESVRTAKYWITNSNTVGIIPTRLNDKFHIIPSGDDVKNINIGNYVTGYIMCENPEYEWIAWNSYVYFFKYNKRIEIPNWVSSYKYDRIITTWDKYLLTTKRIDSSNKYFVCDTSIVNASTTELQGNLYPCNYDPISNAFTSTDTGIFVSSNYNSKCDIIDVKNGVVYNDVDAYRTACIWGTDRVARLIKDSNEIIIEECTAEGRSTIKSIPFNLDFTNLVLFGHTNHLYIINTQTSTLYHINIDNGEISTDNHEAGWFYEYNFSTYKFTMVDDIIVIYSSMADRISRIYYIDLRNPNSIKSLEGWSSNTYSSGLKCKLKQVKENALLLLVSFISSIGGYDSDVYEYAIDFGRFIREGLVNWRYVRTDDSGSLMTYGDYVIWNGNKKIPIEYFLYHKIIGTTKTISTVNNSKQISNKQWSITMTNVPRYNGLPPGNIQ